MPEEESQQDPFQVFRELQATTEPESEKDNALEGFVNLYESIKNGTKPGDEDEIYLTNFLGHFEEEVSKSDELKKVVDEVQDAILGND